MSAAFTPGPWEVLHDGGYGTVPGYSIEGGEFIVALAIGDLEKIPAEANARLIAAAPDLLEAAETVLAGLNERINAACQSDAGNVPVFAGIAALSDAINKARGEA